MTFTSRITLDMRSGPAANDKASNSNTKTKYEICSKLTIKTPERCHWRGFGVFIVNFEHISHLFLMFL